MKFLETEEEKKSFAITVALFAILFFLFAFLGLTYMDPPPENGIAINFGTSDTGQGEIQPTQPVQAAAQPQSTPAPSQENLLSQETDESPVVAPEKTKAKSETNTTPKETVKPKEKEQPKTNSVLDGMIKGKDKGTTTGGHGNDGTPGDKGDINGDLYANSFWGSGKGNGGGKGTKWGLNGRNIKGNNKVLQECNESGTIVVQVTVNKQGQVIKAEYSPKGSNASSECLKKAAIATAKTFQWQPDENAPNSQVGFIEINFSLGE